MHYAWNKKRKNVPIVTTATPRTASNQQKMTNQNELVHISESQDTADIATDWHLNDIASSTSESTQEQRRPVNSLRKMMIVKALRAESPGKREKWRDIRAEDLESAEISTTLKHILEDYASCADVVNGRSALSLQNIETSNQMLGGKAYRRMQTKLFKQNPLCEFSAESIPEFKAPTPTFSRAPTSSELQMKPLRCPSKGISVLREKSWDQAIWKASAVRPSSAFERKLKRLNTVGSDSLPQPIPIDTVKEVSRWPTTSSSHHSQHGPKCASQQTLLMREKSPIASKVIYDVVVPKDRSDLYNEVKDFLLTKLQDLPDDATPSSPRYVAIFLEALELFSDGLTTYKPLLQAIVSELKCVFHIQNQFVKDKEDCKLAAKHLKEKLELQLQVQLNEMKVKLETQSRADVEKMRKRVDELWDKKEFSEKKRAELETVLQSNTKRCLDLAEENAKLKIALQEVIDHHRKIEIVNDDRLKLKGEIRQLHEAVAVMIPKDEIFVCREKILEQERQCQELLRQRDHCKELLLNMVNETKETFKMALENEHKKAEKLFDGSNSGSDIIDFLSVANSELAHLSDTLDRVKGLYNKFTIRERVCTWKSKFNLGESWSEFSTVNDADVPQFLRCNLKLVVNLPSVKEINLTIQDIWTDFTKLFKLNPKAKVVDFMRLYCERRFADEKERFLFAYNFYFGLKRDAVKLDAECMLNILHGEMMEGTYAMMKQQCSDVLTMCAKLDVDSTDCIPKSKFLEKLSKLFSLKKKKLFDNLVVILEDHPGSEIYYNRLLKPDSQYAACGFALELQQQVIEERATFLELCVSSLERIDMFGCGLLKFNDFKSLFRILDPEASLEHVETTVFNVINFDFVSTGHMDASTKQVAETFPVAKFISNLRLLPDLRCYTNFDLLKSVDDVRTTYLIEKKQNA